MQPEDDRPRGSPLALWAALIVPLCFLVYSPAMRGEFIWDDVDIYVVNNDLLPRPDGLWKFWFTTEALDYYPLAYSTYWFEYRLWGLDPAGYHATNVALHAAAAVLLVWTLRQMRSPGAGAAGLLFALHPVAVETVAWIAQRKTVLAGALAIACVGCFARGRRLGRSGWLVAAALLFLLSLASKPIAIALPVALLLQAWLERGRIQRGDLLAAAPLFVVALLMGAVGVWFQEVNVKGAVGVRDAAVLDRILIGARAVWFYLWKDVLPVGLCFEYPRWSVVSASAWSWLPLVGLAATAGGCLLLRRRGGGACFLAGAWFVLAALPALGVVDVFYWRYSFVGDHYQYLSLAVFVAFAAAAVDGVFRKVSAPPVVARMILVVAALTLGTLTARHARNFSSAERLWRATLAQNPAAWLAHSHLADILQARGERSEAAMHYRDALALRPDLGESHNNWGLVLRQEGRQREAVAEFREAARLRPDDATTRTNLAGALAEAGEFAEAEKAFRDAQEVMDRQRWHGAKPTPPLLVWAQILEKVGRKSDAAKVRSEFEGRSEAGTSGRGETKG